MKRILSCILFAIYTAFTVLLTGCIENDVPLPVIEPRITAMDVEGALDVMIDSQTRSVKITLDETTDIRSVNIRSITFEHSQTQASWNIRVCMIYRKNSR